MPIQAHQYGAQVLYSVTTTGGVGAYTAGAQVLYDHWEGETKAFSLTAQVMHKPPFDGKAFHYSAQVLYDPPSLLNVYSLVAQVMHRADLDYETDGYVNIGRMNIEEEDVIYYDIIFPECISYGSTGVPRYQTEKAEVQSGDEQRNARWAYPKHEYSINMENLPANELAEVMNIWHVVRGDFIGFMFMDPLDHTSSNTANALSGTDVTAADQFIATTVSGITDFPLFKEYRVNDRLVQRRIKYPKDGTLVVQLDGIATTQWTYNYDRCLLEWDMTQGDTETIAVAAGVYVNAAGWDDLEPGDLISFSGFSNPGNNTPDAPHRVVTVAGSNLTVQTYGEGVPATVDEAPAVRTWAQATPPTGATMRAGYYFYVPVRFDDGADAMAEIQAGLRETSFTNLGDIKLKEIFE